jgi:hypothetical protein
MIYTAHEVAALFILALLLGTIMGYLAGYDHAESHAIARRNAERRHKYKTDNNTKEKPR